MLTQRSGRTVARLPGGRFCVTTRSPMNPGTLLSRSQKETCSCGPQNPVSYLARVTRVLVLGGLAGWCGPAHWPPSSFAAAPCRPCQIWGWSDLRQPNPALRKQTVGVGHALGPRDATNTSQADRIAWRENVTRGRQHLADCQPRLTRFSEVISGHPRTENKPGKTEKLSHSNAPYRAEPHFPLVLEPDSDETLWSCGFRPRNNKQSRHDPKLGGWKRASGKQGQGVSVQCEWSPQLVQLRRSHFVKPLGPSPSFSLFSTPPLAWNLCLVT